MMGHLIHRRYARPSSGKLASAAALPLLLLLLMAGCKREAPADPATAAPAAAQSATTTTPAAASAHDATGPKAFDPTDLAVSDAPLGAFPYLGLPDGYEAADIVQNDYDRVPFWTGDRLEWVEGKVYASVLRSTGERPYSPLELSRNVQAVVESVGGKRIFDGAIPAEASKEIGDSKAGVTYVGGLGDIYNEPSQTYVIHRADRDIWIHVSAGSGEGGWIIAETKALVTTARILPADALKQALDADGKVAIQVNFATDAAQVLADSEPQLAQVTALLRADPQLKLAVEGHTDNSGTPAHNQQLSQARADAVVQRLVASGIAAERLAAQGFGQTRPVAGNNDEAGRARNRRVELVKR